MHAARWVFLFLTIGALGVGLGGCPAPDLPADLPPVDDGGSTPDDGTPDPITLPPVVAGISVTSPGGNSGKPPQATDLHAGTFRDTPNTIELVGVSSASESLRFSIVAPPEAGNVTTPISTDNRHATVVFTPAPGFIGTTQFSFVARNDAGASNVATVQVDVVVPVWFDITPGGGASGLTAVAAAYTVDEGGFPPGELCWSFGDTQECGPVQSHATRSHAFSAAGTYAISLALLLPGVSTPLVCLTADGQPSAPFVAGAASAANQPPVANAGPDQLVVDLNGDGTEPVTFNGGGSHDVDGTLVNYRWSEGTTVHFTGSSPTAAVSLGVGIHTIALQVTDNQGATASDTVVVIVGTAGTLRVTPDSGLSATGALSGPFAPESKSFTLQNTGVDPITWAASSSQGWVGLSSPTGTLVPGATTSVTVSIGASASALGAGSHAAQITFQNLTNGRGNTTRTVNLTVTSPPAELEVTPVSNFTTAGVQGGPFTPSALTYTLANRGTQTLTWRVSKTQTWLNLSSTTGVLLPNQTMTVTAALDGSTAAQAPGTYSDTLVFSNLTTGAGNTTRTATLTVAAPPGALAVGPESGLAAAGLTGGPFTPGSTAYTLTNTGGQTIAWTATKTAAWLQLSPSSGVLSAGASAQVTATVGGTAGTLPAGSYSDVVTFTNTTNGAGNTTRPATLNIVAPGGLLVSPGTTLAASGPVGGPFAPPSLTYTLSNTGGSTIDWSATKTHNWISMSRMSGTLAVGESMTVGVAISSAANTLAAGNYSGSVTFTNTTNGTGNTTRGVSLSVLAPGVLVVAPSTHYATSGNVGGTTWAPASKSYTLTNAGAQSLNWSVTKTAAWVQLSSPSSGTLAPGASVNVSVWPNSNAGSLAAGTHTDTLTFTNTTNGNGNTTRTVTLTAVAPGTLSVAPGSGWSPTGAPGGPFSPATLVYTLTNPGSQSINWTAAADQNWLTLSSTSGTLAAGGSTTVTLSLASAASSLGTGTYTANVVFVNTTNGLGDVARDVTLTVTTGPQMASSVSQYGITWTFDKNYQIGQFITGDWWVCPSTPAGTVTVVSVSPAPLGSGTGFRNGTMVNPPAGRVAYDGRHASNDPNYLAAYPLSLSANTSVVSTISLSESPYLDLLGVNVATSTVVKVAAVLTCLAEPPAGDAYRPPYSGTAKPIYRDSQINWDGLPSLGLPPSYTKHPTVAICLRLVQRPWIDHAGVQLGRQMHPADNMPNYGREVAGTVGDVALMMCTNIPTASEKRTLGRGLVQIGIDTSGVVAQDPDIWMVASGHNGGRKFPILFAAKMLNLPSLIPAGAIFQEDCTYYGHEANPPQALWTGWQNSGHQYAANVMYLYQNDWYHESYTPAQWWSPPFPQGGQWPGYKASLSNSGKHEGYRRLTTFAWVGQTLAARTLGMTSLWNHPSYFAYMDRWMYEDEMAPGGVYDQAMQAGWDPPTCSPLGGTAWFVKGSEYFAQQMYLYHRPSY